MSRTPRRLTADPPASAARRETIAATLPDGRRVELLRVVDPRARRIKLSVSERGARLTLPPRASLRRAERFLAEQLPWLAEQLDRHPPPPARPPFEFGSDATLPLRDVAWPVHWREGTRLGVARQEDRIEVVQPAHARPASLRRALREFYLAEARRDVGQWLPRYLAGLPRAPRQIRLRPLRSLWGSLAPDGSLSLDLALVLGPPAAFEYVLVHELCHLIHADHSRRFWAEVERRCPDWRAHRRWFRADGMAMKAALARLIAP